MKRVCNDNKLKPEKVKNRDSKFFQTKEACQKTMNLAQKLQKPT